VAIRRGMTGVERESGFMLKIQTQIRRGTNIEMRGGGERSRKLNSQGGEKRLALDGREKGTQGPGIKKSENAIRPIRI